MRRAPLLWKVDDKATFELVRSFYTRLESTGPVEALRQAQLETMRAFPHPYAWAAFGLSGLPRCRGRGLTQRELIRGATSS